MKAKHKRLLVPLMAALILVQQSNAIAFASDISEVQASSSETGAETGEDQKETEKTESTDFATKQDFTYSQSGIEVDAHLSSPAAENAELSLAKVDPDAFNNEAFTQWIGEQTVIGAEIYDINLTDASGNKIETGEVNFKINLSEIAVPESEGVETTLRFLHITDDGTVEEGTVSEDGTSAELTANGLSTFVFVRTASASKEEKDKILPVGTEDGNTFYVDSMETLQSALTTINEGEGSYTIHLKEDITMTSSINLQKNTVTIIGDGHTINFQNSEVPIRVDGGEAASPYLF